MDRERIRRPLGEIIRKCAATVATIRATEQAFQRIFGYDIDLRSQDHVSFQEQSFIAETAKNQRISDNFIFSRLEEIGLPIEEIADFSQTTEVVQKKSARPHFLLSAKDFRYLAVNPQNQERREIASIESVNLFKTLAQLVLDNAPQRLVLPKNQKFIPYLCEETIRYILEKTANSQWGQEFSRFAQGLQKELAQDNSLQLEAIGAEVFLVNDQGMIHNFFLEHHVGVALILRDYLESKFMRLMETRNTWFIPQRSWTNQHSENYQRIMTQAQEVIEMMGIENPQDIFKNYISSQIATYLVNSTIEELFPVATEEEINALRKHYLERTPEPGEPVVTFNISSPLQEDVETDEVLEPESDLPEDFEKDVWVSYTRKRTLKGKVVNDI